MAVHGDKAIAYVCNGSTVEGWMRGTVQGDKLVLTGKNKAHLTASYHAGKVTGDVALPGYQPTTEGNSKQIRLAAKALRVSIGRSTRSSPSMAQRP